MIASINVDFLTALISGASSIVVALGTVWLKHNLEVRKSAKNKIEESITGNDVAIMVEIEEFLNTIVDKWTFDRAAIFQFHNGGKFFNGVSMKKFSLTYEVAAPGIAKVKGSSQNVFVTEYPSLIKALNEKEFFHIDSESPALDYMRDKIEEQGILQIISVPIRNLNGALTAFVQFTTIKKHVVVTDQMQEDLVQSCERISGYLS